ncbi:hypothetical protein ACF0H5_018398 [Mactra antiquata]
MPDWLISRQNNHTGNDKCQTHPDNELDTMCKDHDVICCGACAVTIHRTCKNVIELKEIDVSTDRQTLIQSYVSLLATLQSLNTGRKQDQSKLRLSTAASLRNIRQFRRKINDRFDELERMMIETIDSKCIEIDNAAKNDISELEKGITLLETSVQELNLQHEDTNSVKGHRDNLNLKKLLNSTKIKCEQIERYQLEEVHFFPNKKLEKYIDALQNIGYCTKYPRNHRTTIDSIELTGINEASLDFQDMVKSDTGDLIIADCSTKQILVIDENYTVTRTYDLLQSNGGSSVIGEPHSVCCISSNEVAVSLERDKLIAIIDVKSDNGNQRYIEVGEHCRGIGFNSSTRELFVACGGGSFTNESLGHISVYSLQGDCLRYFHRGNDDKKAMLIRPLYLAISNDHSKMYVLDGIKGIICISTEGEIIKRYSTSNIEDATGLCVDNNDNILVACGKYNMIIRIANNMTSCEQITDEETGLTDIPSICYDCKNNTCLVGRSNSHLIHTIQL